MIQPSDSLAGPIHSAIDTFRAVNDVGRSRSGRAFEGVVAWRLLDANLKPSSAALQSPQEQAWADRDATVRAVVVPPLTMITLPQLQAVVAANRGIAVHARRLHDEGHHVCAIGTGVWLLAAGGLLDGLQAPVQWGIQSGFARSFPNIVVTHDEIASAGRLVMAAAPSLTHECIFRLLEQMGEGQLAAATRDKLIYNPVRQQLAGNMTVATVSGGVTRDSPLYRAVTWMTKHAQDPISIETAASEATVSERTLTRLFKQHLGMTPHDFLTDVRMKRAQMWLEVTLKSVEVIANECGYTHVASFRRVFKERFEMTPAEYRRRYTTRAPRARWKIEDL